MSRRTVGSILLMTGAIVYSIDWGVRHLGAMLFIATKTGDTSGQYAVAVALGENSLLPIAMAAFVVGLAYLAWAELRPGDRA